MTEPPVPWFVGAEARSMDNSCVSHSLKRYRRVMESLRVLRHTFLATLLVSLCLVPISLVIVPFIQF